MESALIIIGGFFFTGTDEDLVPDYKDGKNGAPLAPVKYRCYSIGHASITNNTVDVPSIYADMYERYTANDRTFLTSGPDLKKRVDTTIPPQDQAIQMPAGFRTRSIRLRATVSLLHLRATFSGLSSSKYPVEW